MWTIQRKIETACSETEFNQISSLTVPANRLTRYIISLRFDRRQTINHFLARGSIFPTTHRHACVVSCCLYTMCQGAARKQFHERARPSIPITRAVARICETIVCSSKYTCSPVQNYTVVSTLIVIYVGIM